MSRTSNSAPTQRARAFTPSERICFVLKKESKRWDNTTPHYRYTFEEIGREPVVEEPQGLVLEEAPLCGEPSYSWHGAESIVGESTDV